MKKLYEFSAMVEVDIVVAANSEEEARKEIELLDSAGWLAVGDKQEYISNIDLFDIREIKNDDDLDDLAHIITQQGIQPTC